MKAHRKHCLRPFPLLLSLACAVPALAACSLLDKEPHSIGSILDGGLPQGPRATEECGNGLDDDGDGEIEEGCYCASGETLACFSGPFAARARGGCGDGLMRCQVEGSIEFGMWGGCAESVLPGEEVCDNSIDDDCDGAVDEGCVCSSSEERACATESTVSPCRAGTQRCGADGQWSACEGAISPSPEVCEDGIDNDCDGQTNEGCGCVPEPEACSDGIDNDCDGDIDEAACRVCREEDGLSHSWDHVLVGQAVGSAPASSQPLSVAVDSRSQIYATGAFTGSLDFGGGLRSGTGDSLPGNGFIVSYRSDGTYRWDRVLTSAQSSMSDVAVLGDRVVVVGSFYGESTFAGAPLVSTGDRDGFVAVLDLSGRVSWTKVIGGPGEDWAGQVVIHPDGSLVVGGTISESGADLGGGTRSVVGHSDPFLLALDRDGNYRWDRMLPGTGSASISDIETDASGDIYVSGLMTEDIDLGAGARFVEGFGGFVASYDAGGDLRWDHPLTARLVHVFDLAVTTEGVVAGGRFAGDVTYPGGPTRSATGGEDGYIVSFGFDGAYQWDQRFAGTSFTQVNGIAYDPCGRLMVAGIFASRHDFGFGQHRTVGADDAFAVVLDLEGTRLAEWVGGSRALDHANDVAVDAAGRPVVIGTVGEDEADLGGGIRESGPLSGFIVRLE